MKAKTIPKSIILIFNIVFIITLIVQSNDVTAQNSSKQWIQIGDTVTYSFISTGAYIPYGDQVLTFKVQNLTDANNVLIDVLYEVKGTRELLNESVSAGWYILNNNSLLSSWATCPLHNITESKIYQYWTLGNIQNISEYYNDVARDAIELSYTYDTVLNGNNYSIAVRWVWDYSTGVLLNNSIKFSNQFDYSLSGLYEQFLLETTIWELNPDVIPGFPLVWVLFFTGFTLIIISFLNRKKTTWKIIQKGKIKVKTMVMGLLLLSSSCIFTHIAFPKVSASQLRMMPIANALLLTNNSNSVLATSLSLDDFIHYSLYVEGVNSTNDLLVLDYNNYDTIIADSYLPDNLEVLYKLKGAINGSEADLGLIFFGGNYTENALITISSLLPVEFVIDRGLLNTTIIEFYLEQSGILVFATDEFYKRLYDQTNFFEIQTNDIQVSVSDEQKALSEENRSMYVTRIAWESTPLLYERILTYAKKPSATTLIEVPNSKEPLIVTWDQDWNGDNESSQVIYISPGVASIWDYTEGEEHEWNTPFRLWPYFNYMLYMMIYDTKGLEPEEIESYADWPWSPIPHRQEAIIWMVFVGSLWVFNFTLFFVLRRKSRKRDLAKSDNSPNLEDLPSKESKNESD